MDGTRPSLADPEPPEAAFDWLQRLLETSVSAYGSYSLPSECVLGFTEFFIRTFDQVIACDPVLLATFRRDT